MSADIDCVVGLGSNLGDRQQMLAQGVLSTARLGELLAVSALYESAPLGPPQPDYLNAALRLRTGMEPLGLLQELLGIEKALGRDRRERWGPRTLDLDILWVEGVALSQGELVVPHPELEKRLFALWPLLDVAPHALSSSGQPYVELARQLDPSAVRRLPGSAQGSWMPRWG